MKKIIIIFWVSLLSIQSFASQNLSIDVEKKILDYRLTLEKSIKSKLMLQKGLEDIAVTSKLKTIFSSERLKQVRKDLIFPVSSIDIPQYNKVFIDSLAFTVHSTTLLSMNMQSRVIEEIESITGFDDLEVTFLTRDNPSVQFNYAPIILSLAVLLGFLFVFIVFFRKEKIVDDSLSKAEAVELENCLGKLTESLKQNINFLDEYMNQKTFDRIGMKTLVMYLDLNFSKEKIFSRENLKIINSTHSMYSPREFKVWLAGVVERLNLSDVVLKEEPVSDIYDFSVISSVTIKEYQKIFKCLSEEDMITYIRTLPGHLKFISIESLMQGNYNNIHEILEKITNYSSYKNDFDSLKKVEMKIKDFRKERKIDDEAA